MANPTPISLGLRSNQARDVAAGSAKLVNCYADDVGEDAKFRHPLYACDGWASYATLTAGGQTRGMINIDDTRLWVMTGAQLYRVATDGTATLGDSVGSSGAVYFARNRAATPDVFMVTSDAVLRKMSGTTISTPSFTSDFGPSLFNSVVGHSGYFIITKSNGEFYISGIDATTFDVVDFSTAQNNADGLTRGMARGRDLVLFGPRSTEFWQNTGNADFPYQPIHMANYGLYAGPAAVSLVADGDSGLTDQIIWPATGPDGGYIGVCQLSGYEARKISTWEVDNAIRTATKSTLKAYSYPSQGFTFYAITNGSSWTYEFNTRTGFWHQRKSSGLGFSRVYDACVYNGQVIFGDYTSGLLYQLSTSATPASASLVSLRFSRDNGTTWSTARTKAIGASGNRTTRAKFNRFGQSKEDGFQLEISVTNALVEGSNALDMTVIPPAVHAWPNPIVLNTVFVDSIPGVSGTASQKGALALAVDHRKVDC